uniref:Serine/arginine repetitive matrix protein 1-like n=1 Tax=Drosophila rhopaloa TaxID=1041015 RepID=A0A6P4E5K2_DRORH
MSTRMTRSEARRRMAAQTATGPNPGQGWSEDRRTPVTRPTRTSRRVPERVCEPEDSAPEPTISSDSDVEMVDDPAVDRRQWRLRRAVDPMMGIILPGDPNTPGLHGEREFTRADVEAIHLALQEAQQQARRKREAKEEEEERQETAKRRQRYAEAQWESVLRAAQEEEKRLSEGPVLMDEVPPASPGMLEVPRTPRYMPDGEDDEVPAPPKWTPVRPPTPRHVPLFWEEDEEPQASPPPSQHEGENPAEPSPPGKAHSGEGNGKKHQEATPEGRQEQQGTHGLQGRYFRTEIPMANVSHALHSFTVQEVLWRQHAVTWSWPEGPAGAPTEDAEEVRTPPPNLRDPRLRGDHAHVTPTTPPTTAESISADGGRSAQEEEPLEKGPWVWPDPVPGGRPKFARQSSAPDGTIMPQFMRQVSLPDERRWREIPRQEWPPEIEAAPAVLAAQRRGRKQCVLVQQGGPRFRVGLGPS